MSKNILIIIWVFITIFVLAGWYRTLNDYKESVKTISYVLEEWRQVSDNLEKMNYKYMETGNLLNECVFNAQFYKDKELNL